MVKGISRQVILVHGPEQEIFEQAIFILKDKAVGEGITEEALLKEAKRAIHAPEDSVRFSGPLWAAGGALATALLWLVTALL